VPENRGETGKPVPGGEATRWKPGQSGNPGGRPKTARFSQACRELLASLIPGDPRERTYSEAIAEALAVKALAGNIRAAQELVDRAEGRPRQAIEIENARLHEAFERMSADELEAYARDCKLPDWFPRDEETNRDASGGGFAKT